MSKLKHSSSLLNLKQSYCRWSKFYKNLAKESFYACINDNYLDKGNLFIPNKKYKVIKCEYFKKLLNQESITKIEGIILELIVLSSDVRKNII